MPAYMVSHTCATCGQRASHQVFDRWNSSVGHFCSLCGKAKLKALNGPTERKPRGR